MRVDSQNKYRALAAHALKPSSDSPPSGSLIIIDQFRPTENGSQPHGEIVKSSALQWGLSGERVLSIEQNDQSPTPQSPTKLATEVLPPDQAKAAVRTLVVDRFTGTLQMARRNLDRLSDSGTRSSAVNISWGHAKSDQVIEFYANASAAWRAPQGSKHQKQGEILSQNLAHAYGLDQSALLSSDERVAEPERRKLQQALVDGVSQIVDGEPAIKRAKQEWDQSVARFESANNSVIIAAGNGGSLEESLESSNGHRDIKTPTDFSTNILENDQVTSVGATKLKSDGTQVPAHFTSDSSGVDVMALGDLTVSTAQGESLSVEGTSYASARTAATFAELHKRHPEASSPVVEEMFSKGFTKGSQGHQVQEIDPTKMLLSE